MAAKKARQGKSAALVPSAPTGKLVDSQGRKVDTGPLKDELAGPTLVGLRTPWWPSVANILDPATLGAVLTEMDMGNQIQYMVLAYEVEERWPHFFSVLSTRKLAVSGLTLSIEAATDDAQDVKIADAVRDMLDAEMTSPAIYDLMDGISKSYSVSEIMWDRDGKAWWPRELKGRDARFFHYDILTGQELRLYDVADPAFGVPLTPYKFVAHRPNIKTGLPIKRGLARLALVPYLMQSYCLKDWQAFAETMGIPLRLGKYPATATAEEKSILLKAVSGIGIDTAGIVPDTMSIDFETKGTTSGGDRIFADLVEYWDKALSKAVLGQTASTEGTPGKLGNEDSQENVREDIRTNDAKQVAATLRRDLIRPIVDLNFGPQPRGRYPKVTLATETEEDLVKLGSALSVFIDRGLRVEESVIRDRFGLPEPAAGAAVLTPVSKGPPPGQPGAPGAEPGGATPAKTDAAAEADELPADDNESETPTGDAAEAQALQPAKAKPNAGRRAALRSMLIDKVYSGEALSYDERLALAAVAQTRRPPDMCDELAAHGTGGWRRTLAPMLAQVELAAKEATTPEELKTKLAALKLDNRALIESVATATFAARALGLDRDKP